MPIAKFSRDTNPKKPTKLTVGIAGVFALAVGIASAAQASSNIHIVGSSTVYPFITVVAEKFGKLTDFKTPIIESTGSGGGIKLFCTGVGRAHPDFSNTSRRIKESELSKCRDNGVADIIEIKIGYDGIVLANSNATAPMRLTLEEIFLALAKEVPNPDGSQTLIKNPYKTWADVNPALPEYKIEVLGPPPTSGTRDAFVELAMEGGCSQISWLAAMKKTDQVAYKRVCHQIREDGVFIETGENDNLIVRKVVKNPNAVGIFGFSFLDQNTDIVQGIHIEGVPPEYEKIADGSYPITRPLYVYAKVAHIELSPGMKEFMAELSDEDTWGDEGYLTERGLIPMPLAERELFRAAVINQTQMESL